MIKKYKVKSLTLSGLGNKIFKSGDSVTERNFREGNAEKLRQQGFLEADGEIEEPKKVENEETKGAEKFEALLKRAGEEYKKGDLESAKATLQEALILSPESEIAKNILADIENKILNIATQIGDNNNEETDEIIDDGKIKEYHEISENQLKEILKKRGVSFNENSKKKFLYALYCKK